MKGNPLISCIVPVFNGGKYLREAIDSILAQTWRPLEIIVVDDGSTDGSAGIARTYGSALTCLRQKNEGMASARNHGLREASGEFVAFLDADDLWVKGKLEAQMACFARRPDLGICAAQMRNFWIPELASQEREMAGHPFAQPRPGSLTTTLVRREVFETVGLFDTALVHRSEEDWFMRAAAASVPKDVLPDLVMLRRIHQDNWSRNRPSVDPAEWLRLAQASLERQRERA